MTSTQSILNSELSSKHMKRSTEKTSNPSSAKNSSEKRKKKLKKVARRTSRTKQPKVESDSSSSSSSSSSDDESTARPDPPKRKKRRTKKRSYGSYRSQSTTESLATKGREYGNNVSRQNVAKIPERSPTAGKLNHSISKSAASREYGDFFSCQSGLTYLETNRIDQIQAKGIKRFIDEYLKKLKKCEEFESGHSVKPFASVRLKLLNDAGNGKESTVTESTPVATRSLPGAAIKTIEIINRFKAGKSINLAELVTAKKNSESVEANAQNDRRESISKENQNLNETAKPSADAEKMKSDQNMIVVRKTSSPSKLPNDSRDTNLKMVETRPDRSLEKFTRNSISAKKPTSHLQAIEENPSDDSITLSLGRNSIDSLKSPEDPRHGFVLMKKVLTSSENTVTIVDGTKRYDTKNQKVESHYTAGRMPIAGRSNAGANKKSLKSIETLYRTDDLNRTRAKRSQNFVASKIE